MLVIWMRGAVGSRSREELNTRADGNVSPLLVILSWTASAMLMVPVIVAVTAVWPLSDAVVCAERAGGEKTYVAAGRFVAETKERVYIGYDDEGGSRIISIPAGKVSRLLVGERAANPRLCDTAVDDAGPRGG